MNIAWLEGIGAKDIDEVGGKGANLGEMTRAGFPVPPGFCVSARAYRLHIEAGELSSKIAACLARAGDGSDTLEISRRIRELIESKPLGAELEAEIRAAYGRLCSLGSARVAVRSSATAEDLPDASFAGQQETFLSILGADAVVGAVRRCWASAWTERACAYRARMGYDHESVSIAVVVQAMIESETAGVLFTINPISPEKRGMLISASYGLGESVVAGRVDPDSYLISKGPGLRILERRAGGKDSLIRSAEDGETETLATPAARRSGFSLGTRELRALKRLGLEVEAHYGKPQDIEWAVAKGRLYLLQARPVTATGAASRGDHGRKATSSSARILMDSLREHCPVAILPLEFDLIVALQQQKNDIMTELGLTMPKASDTLRMDQEGLIVASEAETRVSLRTLLFFRAARAFLSAYDEEWATGKLEALYSRRAEIRSIDASALDDRSLAAVVSELFDLISEQCAIRFRAHLVPMMLAGKALRLRMRLAGVPRGFAESDFLAGIEYESAVIEARLYALAEAAEALPAVSRLMLETDAGKFLEGLDAAEGGPAFREKLGAFLEEHGARTPTPFLAFSSRSWSERPEDLIAGIAAILRSGAAKERPEQLARSAERSAVAERAVERSLLGGAGFRRSLARYRACFMGRERGLYEIEASFVLLRALIAESAARLLRAGLLESADDIGFAREDELVAALGGEGVEEFSAGIARRKAGRPRALREWAAGGTAGKGALRGAPSAAGLYRGRARIIRGPEDFPRLQRGEVLVCPYTDPTWTALFALAQAVIAETGGPLSHAAIVAREYSIPAVMGVKGAMASLADGQFVEVDGTRGEIRRIPSLDGFSAGKGIGNGQRVL